jgi:hypothetical protein
MCFSATASFLTSAILVPLGCYAIKHAYQFNKRYLVLAFIPLLFALQQFFEGLEWLCFNHEQYKFLPILSLVYLFFAFFLWPAYFSFAVCMVKPCQTRKYLLFIATVFGIILGLSLYVPVLLDSSYYSLRIVNHSLCYSNKASYFENYLNAILYLSMLLFSLFTSSIKNLKYWGVVLFISYAVSYWFFYQAFASVW